MWLALLTIGEFAVEDMAVWKWTVEHATFLVECDTTMQKAAHKATWMKELLSIEGQELFEQEGEKVVGLAAFVDCVRTKSGQC